MRRAGRVSGALASLLLAGCLSDRDVRPGLAAYDVDSTGVALHGYSPVSYFEDGRAERGAPGVQRTWRGITYRFTDEDQARRFDADPARYEPAFGGWCAYGISLGIRWDPDPEAFEIVGGRLLLFSRNGQADARELWNRENDPKALLQRSDHYWGTLVSD